MARTANNDECCPECGCNVFAVVNLAPHPWRKEKQQETRRCDHCRSEWDVTVEIREAIPPQLHKGKYGIVYVPLLCPWCGSRNHVVTKTMKGTPVRYHFCRDCNQNFRSTERLPTQ